MKFKTISAGFSLRDRTFAYKWESTKFTVTLHGILPHLYWLVIYSASHLEQTIHFMPEKNLRVTNDIHIDKLYMHSSFA